MFRAIALLLFALPLSAQGMHVDTTFDDFYHAEELDIRYGPFPLEPGLELWITSELDPWPDGTHRCFPHVELLGDSGTPFGTVAKWRFGQDNIITSGLLVSNKVDMSELLIYAFLHTGEGVLLLEAEDLGYRKVFQVGKEVGSAVREVITQSITLKDNGRPPPCGITRAWALSQLQP